MQAHSRTFFVNHEQYEYWFEEDVEEDNIKKFHSIRKIGADGSTSMDWSPYYTPNELDLVMYVQLGFPKRRKGGPLNSKDLQELLETKIGKFIVE